MNTAGASQSINSGVASSSSSSRPDASSKTRSSSSSAASQGSSNSNSSMLQKKKNAKANDPLGSSSSHSVGSMKGVFSQRSAPSCKQLRSKGFKYGVREVNVDELGTRTSSTHSRTGLSLLEEEDFENDSLGSEQSVFWEDEEERDIRNPALRGLVNCLIFFRCLPKSPMDSTPLKNTLRLLQWIALLFDMTAAIVAIVSFSGNTVCCGQPILNIIGSASWDLIIPLTSYLYAALIVAEIYPVVRKGFPFNIVNPILGCALTVAMFFDDSLRMALSMWGLEALAVVSECAIYVAKAIQKKQLKEEMLRVGRLTNLKREPHEDRVKFEKELKRNRQRYFQLKQTYRYEHRMLWYLAIGNVFNFILIGFVMLLILAVYQAGGLCIDMDGKVPNPFDQDQMGFCHGCPSDDPSEPCEVCTEEYNMCYFPYS